MQEDKFDNSRVFEQFVAPPKQNIRERYTFRLEQGEKEAGRWPHPTVIVEQHNEDGTVEDIFTYKRNYSMGKTFEPFRQLKDGVWHDYALISPEYVRFSVLDLESREIIATEAYPTITEKHHERWRKMGYDKWCEDEPIGTEKPGWGFCPVEFYVPDWAEEFEHDSLNRYFTMKKDEEKHFYYDEEDMMRFTGQYALYSGCVWGDDSGGWKIRHIDLSRISEGVVTSDQRYGYLQFAGKSLKEINIWSDGNRMVIPVEIYIDIDTGKAFPIEANWREGDETWQDES